MKSLIGISPSICVSVVKTNQFLSGNKPDCNGADNDTQAKPGQIVFTNKARCRDCNRCVRCVRQGIRVVRGQASRRDHLCIACGTASATAPGAKTSGNDVDARPYREKRVTVTVAATWRLVAAVFTPWERKRLPSALRKLVSPSEETAV